MPLQVAKNPGKKINPTFLYRTITNLPAENMIQKFTNRRQNLTRSVSTTGNLLVNNFRR